MSNIACGSGRFGYSRDSRLYTPSRDLKSGMPQLTLTPAPVRTRIFFAFLMCWTASFNVRTALSRSRCGVTANEMIRPERRFQVHNSRTNKNNRFHLHSIASVVSSGMWKLCSRTPMISRGFAPFCICCRTWNDSHRQPTSKNSRFKMNSPSLAHSACSRNPRHPNHHHQMRSWSHWCSSSSSPLDSVGPTWAEILASRVIYFSRADWYRSSSSGFLILWSLNRCSLSCRHFLKKFPLKKEKSLDKILWKHFDFNFISSHLEFLALFAFNCDVC